MDIQRLAALCALALASLPATSSAQKAASSDVIVVSDVRSYSSEIVGNGEMRRPGEIDFSFRNSGPVAANAIRFEVRDESGRYLKTIDECGTFAPKVLIHKSTANESLSTTIAVIVVRAKFSDGSVWQRESASN